MPLHIYFVCYEAIIGLKESYIRLDENNKETGLFQWYAWLGCFLFVFVLPIPLSITVTKPLESFVLRKHNCYKVCFLFEPVL